MLLQLIMVSASTLTTNENHNQKKKNKAAVLLQAPGFAAIELNLHSPSSEGHVTCLSHNYTDYLRPIDGVPIVQ